MPRVIARNNRVGLKISQHLPVGLLKGNTVNPVLLIKLHLPIKIVDYLTAELTRRVVIENRG